MTWKKRIAGAAVALGVLTGSTLVAAPAEARTLDCRGYPGKGMYSANCDTDAPVMVTLSWTCKSWWGGKGSSGSRSFRVTSPGLSIGATTDCNRGYYSYGIGHRWL